jgi:hypothetical protein
MNKSIDEIDKYPTENWIHGWLKYNWKKRIIIKRLVIVLEGILNNKEKPLG